jgi:dephospho-CoA kinase
VKVIGLTGGVGMGKSTCAALFAKRDFPVVDTDLLARQVVEPGQPALLEIQELFGRAIVGTDGHLRRRELARQVFADCKRRRQLEAVVHPRIRERWLAQVESMRAAGRKHAVVVIPLLFETDAARLFDTIVCAACSAASQRQRLEARGWKTAEIEQRIQAQWPIEKKMTLAHYVVWTEAGLDVLAAQVDRIIASWADK